MESHDINTNPNSARKFLQKSSSSLYINFTSSKSLRHLPKPALKEKSRSMTSINSTGTPFLKMSFEELERNYSKAFSLLRGENGTPINPKKALQLFVEVANQLAYHSPSMYIPPQLRTKIDRDAQVPSKEELQAREMCTDAAYRVACCFHEGIGVGKNLSKAKRWYKKIAEPNHRTNELGLLSAQLNLSKIYVSQISQELKTSGKVRRSLLEKSRLHLFRASLQPSVEAHLLLGDHYNNLLDNEQALIHYYYAFNLIDDDSTKTSGIHFGTKEILELHQHILKMMAAFTQEDFDKAKKKADQYKQSAVGLNPKLEQSTWLNISFPK